jgi:hypothetical protein
MFGFLEFAGYEKKLRKVKEEHFARVADLEDKIHKQQLDYRELDVKHKHDLKEVEQDYKLQVQELVSRHEKELKTATHSLEIEKDKFNVERQRIETEHERTLNATKLKTEKEVYAKLSELVEREGQAKETVVTAQAELLKVIRDAIPNVNWDRQDGSPKLAIEHNGTPKQSIDITTTDATATGNAKPVRKRTKKRK